MNICEQQFGDNVVLSFQFMMKNFNFFLNWTIQHVRRYFCHWIWCFGNSLLITSFWKWRNWDYNRQFVIRLSLNFNEWIFKWLGEPTTLQLSSSSHCRLRCFRLYPTVFLGTLWFHKGYPEVPQMFKSSFFKMHFKSCWNCNKKH